MRRRCSPKATSTGATASRCPEDSTAGAPEPITGSQSWVSTLPCQRTATRLTACGPREEVMTYAVAPKAAQRQVSCRAQRAELCSRAVGVRRAASAALIRREVVVGMLVLPKADQRSTEESAHYARRRRAVGGCRAAPLRVTARAVLLWLRFVAGGERPLEKRARTPQSPGRAARVYCKRSSAEERPRQPRSHEVRRTPRK